MNHKYDNSFANQWLIAPNIQRDYYDQYCQTQTVGQANCDRRPFRRMADLWYIGLVFAARKKLEPYDLTENTFPFISVGEIFNPDGWEIQFLMLIAVAKEENLEIVGEPKRVVDIANALAAAGVPHIIEMLQSGELDPIWNLSESIDEMLREEQENSIIPS